MKLQLPELQIEDKLARKIQSKRDQKKSQEKAKSGVLIHSVLPYLLEILQTKIINKHYNDTLASHFDVDKT